MDDTLSPTPATTAEEVMVSSQEEGAVGGSVGETGGAAGGEEPGEEAEAWAAALPPVSPLLLFIHPVVMRYSLCGKLLDKYSSPFCFRSGCPSSDRI